MKIYVSAQADKKGNGSKESPFHTISEAAETAVSGDEVIVLPGLYREYVNPRNGGKNEKERIVYRSETPGEAMITGSERAENWTCYEGNVWRFEIPNYIFGGYNPYTEHISGDWYFENMPLHTGEVFFNGMAMYEAHTLEEALNPVVSKKSWEKEKSLYKWYTEQSGENTVIYANFQGEDPNSNMVEFTVRRNCFMPEKEGVNYIALKGFVIRQAATQWAPPTAYQDGMVGPHWSKGWMIEDCEICDSKCSGISLGKYLQKNNENRWSVSGYKHGTQNERDAICQAQYEGWNKETIGSHIIRNCNIHDCGQAGIVGHLGGVFSIIENNHIHHINNKQELIGAEIGGIKMHAAIDVIFRHNHIHHCTRGLWLDWQAQGTRVTANLFHDNTPPDGVELELAFETGEDIFVEVSHGPTLIDNNVMLSTCAARLSTQGCAFVHNLIAGSFTAVGIGTNMNVEPYPTPRYTPYHIPHRTEVAGFMSILHGDMRFYNNIFVQQKPTNGIKRLADRLNGQGMEGEFGAPNLICGTIPYEGYPSWEEYMSSLQKPTGFGFQTLKQYFQKLPVAAAGNAYFNGACPKKEEERSFVDRVHEIVFELCEKNGKYYLNTNLYGFLEKGVVEMITTKKLGEAFEPEQRFENPDGTEIDFDHDYFGRKWENDIVPGPFRKEEYVGEGFGLSFG